MPVRPVRAPHATTVDFDTRARSTSLITQGDTQWKRICSKLSTTGECLRLRPGYNNALSDRTVCGTPYLVAA